MARKTNAVPYRCPKCQAEASRYGRLVFSDETDTPMCPHHKNEPLVPSPRPAKAEPNIVCDVNADEFTNEGETSK